MAASCAAVRFTILSLVVLCAITDSLWASPATHYVAAGGFHTCALTALPTGGVKCWGSNLNGQLGDGTKTERATPTQVQNLTSGVSSIVAGEYHTCALIAVDGSVKCWGANAIGQLGDRSGMDQTSPVNVLSSSGNPLTGVVSINAGRGHTCAMLSDGTALCWGQNNSGQLGVGNTFNTNIPSFVLASSISQISAGGAHTCLVQFNTHEIKCSGQNTYGQLGDHTTGHSNIPVAVFGISTGVQVATGLSHSCGILSNSKLYCWGQNSRGQLGDNGSNTDSSVPVAVANLGNDVTKVTAGGVTVGHTCAIYGATNDLSCWGAGDYGQLGDSLGTDTNAPTGVNGISSVLDVSAGGTHTCAVDSSCHVMCWGSNASHQIGDGSAVANRYSPVTAMTCVNIAPTATPTPTPTATPDACASETACVPDPSLTSALTPRNPNFSVTAGSKITITIEPLKAGIPTDLVLREILRRKMAKFFKTKIPNIAKVLRTMRIFYAIDIRPAPRSVTELSTSSTPASSTRLRLETRKTRVTSRFTPGTYIAKVTINLRDSRGRLFSSSKAGAGTRFRVP